MRTDNEILNNCADYLEENGWVQGTGVLRTGERCTIGVLSYFTSSWERPGQKLVRFLGLRTVYDLPKWNDKKERTKEEVIAAFRGAATHEYAD